MPFYAVAKGRKIGVFEIWKECTSSIFKFKGAVYKKFNTKDEANQFIIDYNKAPNKHIYSKINTIENVECDYFVYVDGSCDKNGFKNAIAGIGIFFGIDDPRNVSRRILGKQTNNVAELKAIIETYKIIENDILINKKITIVSDSEYAIKCIKSYGDKCNADNWQKDIPNKELVKEVYLLFKDKPNIKFMHIMAHTNKRDVHSMGNHHADLLATQALSIKYIIQNNNPIKNTLK